MNHESESVTSLATLRDADVLQYTISILLEMFLNRCNVQRGNKKLSFLATAKCGFMYMANYGNKTDTRFPPNMVHFPPSYSASTEHIGEKQTYIDFF